jgi:hypothetical protein
MGRRHGLKDQHLRARQLRQFGTSLYEDDVFLIEHAAEQPTIPMLKIAPEVSACLLQGLTVDLVDETPLNAEVALVASKLNTRPIEALAE